MGSNGVPFNGKGRPINPRFSLNNEAAGVETDEFAPKKSAGVFPERIRRAAPQSFAESADAKPVSFGSGVRDRNVSPNSLFSSEDDGLSLDVGVNETDNGSSRAVPPVRTPKVPVFDVKRKDFNAPSVPSPEEGKGSSAATGRFTSPSRSGNSLEDDDLSLDVGVNDADSSPTRPTQSGPSETVSSPVSRPLAKKDEGSSVRVPVSSPTPAVAAPVAPAILPVSPVKRADAPAEEELSLDIGVNETEQPAKETAVQSPPVPVITPPAVPVKRVEAPVEEELSLDVGVNETEGTGEAEKVEAPPTPRTFTPSPVVPAPEAPVTPVRERPRLVNPLFADPAPEVEDAGLSLDVGVNETEQASPVKRVVSPLFDFKAETAPVKRPVDVRRVRPDSMMDADGFEDEEKKKKVSSKGKKEVERPRRSFQIQERDIVLLRFLTKYQFSYVDALARMLDSTPQAITKRLRTLEEHDLVKRERIAAGSTLWQARRPGIELAGLNFKENKRTISFATVRHTVGLVNLAAELEREAPGSKDILGLSDKFGEMFPVMNRFPGGIRLYAEEAFETPLTYGEMTVSEREIRQGQKRYRGGRSTAEMRDLVDFSILNPEAPELEPGNEGLFVVYGSGGKTGEHVPDLVVTRPRDENGKPQHFAIELELTPKSPADWKRILRSYRDNGGMYSRIYYFTPDRPIANMLRNADEEVGLGDRLVLRKYTPKNKRQPFLG